MEVLTLPKIAQYAWAAGFFDGEGYIGFSLQKRQSGISYPAQRISITQWYTTTSLQTFRDIFEMGTVERHNQKNENDWRYREQKPSNVKFIMESMFPYLSERKQACWIKTQSAYNEYLEAKQEHLKTCSRGHDQTVNGFKNSAGRHQCRECTLGYQKAYRKRQSELRKSTHAH